MTNEPNLKTDMTDQFAKFTQKCQTYKRKKEGDETLFSKS